jgi:hypothetical protein
MMSGKVADVVMATVAMRKSFGRGTCYLKQANRRKKGSRTSRYAVVREAPIGETADSSLSEWGDAIFLLRMRQLLILFS